MYVWQFLSFNVIPSGYDKYGNVISETAKIKNAAF